MKRLLGDAGLRDDLVSSNVESVDVYSAASSLDGYYAREERDPLHAEALFDALTRLADAIDALKPDAKPEIL